MTDKEDFVPPTEPDAVRELEPDPSEDAIDQGVEESFPASDPVSVNVTKIERTDDGGTVERGRAGST